MEDLQNPFSSNNPVILSEELRQWYIALALIGSNLFAVFWVWYCYRVGLIAEMVVVAASAVVSMFYHTCQTTTACFHLGVQRWTFSDHITAGFVPAIIVIATIRSHTLGEVAQRVRDAWAARSALKPPTPVALTHHHHHIPLGAHCDTATPTSTPSAGEFPEAYMRAALLDAKWTAGISAAYLIVVVLSVVCHPYSLQAFIIVLAFGACAILLKLSVVDRNNPHHLLRRISVPDLSVGLALIAISLVYFVLDGYLYYALFHSLWHVFSNVGGYFYFCGITKGLPGSHSPVGELRAKVRRARRRRDEKRASVRV